MKFNGYELTAEQQAVVDCIVTGEDTKVQAPAGSGKTFVLEASASVIPNKKGLYLAFNKAIADEAKRKFNSNVDCRTGHSVAFQAVGKNYVHRLGKITGWIVTNQLGITNAYPFPSLSAKGYIILDTIKNFCYSNDPKITYRAVPKIKMIIPEEQKQTIQNMIADDAQRLWEMMEDSNSTVPITHDFYLKLWALSKPQLDKDFLLFDECLTGEHKVRMEGKENYTLKGIYNRWIKNKFIPKVKSFNIQTQQYEYKDVTNVIKSPNREVFKVMTEGLNYIRATENHPILTQRGYVEIKDLKIGQDYVLTDRPKNQKTKYILNEDQTQIVIGSFLGDGSVKKQSKLFNIYTLKMGHGDKQIEYLRTKAQAFQCTYELKAKSGYTNKYTINYSGTKVFLLNKNIQDLVHDIDARGLAIWYMDDGSINKDADYISLHSNYFTYEEHLTLKKILLNNFNLNARITKYGKYYGLTFKKEDSLKLIQIIEPYIHRDLMYKIHKKPEESQNYQWDEQFKPYGGKFIKSITKEHALQNVYDITVKDNHNFIVLRQVYSSGMIVHNCQDANPVMLGVVQKQKKAQKIYVGDQYQQIYSWRGAINAMQRLKTEHSVYLTQSFRFGPAVADLASDILQSYMNPDIAPPRIRGFEERQSEIKYTRINDPNCIICRTNNGVINNIFELLEKGKSVYVQGGTKQTENLLKGAQDLMRGKTTWVPDLSLFKNWKEVLDYAGSESGSDLRGLVNLVNKYSIDELLEKLQATQQTAKNADVILTTGHKAKGLEWNKVTLYSDFPTLTEEKETLSQEDTNLIYMSATRALDILDVSLCNACLPETLQRAKNYFIGGLKRIYPKIKKEKTNEQIGTN